MEAKKSYDTALRILKDSVFKNDYLFLAHIIKIEKALTGEDIIYGSKGYIKHNGRWFSPETYKQELYREGFVNYKGKFKKFMGLKNVIIELTYPHVNSFLALKFSGRHIHKKNISFDKLILNRNTSISAQFTVFYRWEVWTFEKPDKGRCFLNLAYDIAKDEWEITRQCEEQKTG